MSTLLVGPSGIISDTRSCVDKYKDVWAKLDESDNFQQRYEVEMGKDVIRPGREGGGVDWCWVVLSGKEHDQEAEEEQQEEEEQQQQRQQQEKKQKPENEEEEEED